MESSTPHNINWCEINLIFSCKKRISNFFQRFGYILFKFEIKQGVYKISKAEISFLINLFKM